MEALKKSRKASRSMFTKNSTELENLIKSDGEINEIRASFELLTAKSDSLKVLDEQIYSLILENEGVTEKDLEGELELREQYGKRYVLLHFQFNEYLEKKKRNRIMMRK